MTVIFVTSIIMFAVIFMDAFAEGTLRAQVITAAIGVLTTAVGYWIGSTSGSQRKTELMSQEKQP